jgi:hypothetical protein
MTAKTDPEWETVQDEPRTKISLEDEGETFIGFYEGTEHITDPNPDKDGNFNEWNQYNFTGIFPDEISGERVAINAGAHLRQALDQIDPMKYVVRITRGRTIPVKNQPSPMVTFKVDKRPA